MPRLRHQLARLMVQNGHEVTFVQKPLFIWQKVSYKNTQEKDKGITLFQSKQLIHHQLRISKFFQWINTSYEKGFLLKRFQRVDSSVVIVNFNYDYIFLRDIFSNNRIITILNDDFVAQCRLPFNGHMESSLKKVCEISDEVLTTSSIVKNKIADYVTAEVFLPWAERKYKFTERQSRDKILIWGYITKRYDLNFLSAVIKENSKYTFYFVGIVDKKIERELEKICLSYENIVVLGPKQLDELPMDEFLASLMLYVSGIDEIRSIVTTNKAFQLLSYGIPLITSGMPYFMDSGSIFKCTSFEEVNQSIYQCANRIDELQPDIEKLVSSNSKEKRLKQFMDLIE